MKIIKFAYKLKIFPNSICIAILWGLVRAASMQQQRKVTFIMDVFE